MYAYGVDNNPDPVLRLAHQTLQREEEARQKILDKEPLHNYFLPALAIPVAFILHPLTLLITIPAAIITMTTAYREDHKWDDPV